MKPKVHVAEEREVAEDVGKDVAGKAVDVVKLPVKKMMKKKKRKQRRREPNTMSVTVKTQKRLR